MNIRESIHYDRVIRYAEYILTDPLNNNTHLSKLKAEMEELAKEVDNNAVNILNEVKISYV